MLNAYFYVLFAFDEIVEGVAIEFMVFLIVGTLHRGYVHEHVDDFLYFEAG